MRARDIKAGMTVSFLLKGQKYSAIVRTVCPTASGCIVVLDNELFSGNIFQIAQQKNDEAWKATLNNEDFGEVSDLKEVKS